jgi:hypothetical protein
MPSRKRSGLTLAGPTVSHLRDVHIRVLSLGELMIGGRKLNYSEKPSATLSTISDPETEPGTVQAEFLC